MDWKFFESLSQTEAKTFLSNFLSVESANIKLLIAHAQNANLTADFSVDSIEPLFQWGIDEIKTISKEPDQNLPDWIRHSSSYRENLFDFSNTSL